MRRAGNGGFSLLEILVVLVILGILAGVGYASLRSMTKRQRLREAVFQVARDLERTRGFAQTKNNDATWTATSSNSYTLDLNGSVLSYNLPAGVIFAPAVVGEAITYTAPYGELTAPPANKIILSYSEGALSMEIHVVGVTGKVITP